VKLGLLQTTSLYVLYNTDPITPTALTLLERHQGKLLDCNRPRYDP